MRLVFVYGMPAVGKLTVAKELAALSGYKLFHNHLAVDLLLSVFEFGSPAFVELRERIWLGVFEEAAKSGLAGLIFTFAPEPSVKAGFVDRVRSVVDGSGGLVEFVELVCRVDELKARLGSKSRLQYKKLADLRLFEELHDGGAFDTSAMPKPIITIDTSQCSPTQAASRIVGALG